MPFQRSSLPKSGHTSSDVRQRDQTLNVHNEDPIQSQSLVKVDSNENTKKDQVVLMTAEANMWNNKAGQYERVLIFIDTGAQRTIINERTAEEFGLPKQ